MGTKRGKESPARERERKMNRDHRVDEENVKDRRSKKVTEKG